MTKIVFSDGSRNFAHNLDDLRERWNIRKEPRTDQEWMPVVLFAEDIKGKSSRDLILLHASLSEIGRDAKTAISKAKKRAHLFGEYSDMDWYHDTQASIISVGIHQQLIQSELSSRPKEERGPKKETPKRIMRRGIPDAFVDVAREKLPESTFKEIMIEAKSRVLGSESATPDPEQGANAARP